MIFYKYSIAHPHKVYFRMGLPVFSEGDVLALQKDTSVVISSTFQNTANYYWRVDVLKNTQTYIGNIGSFTIEVGTPVKFIKE